jgi:hypothetical protein
MNKKIKLTESISISSVHFTLNLPQASRLLGMTIVSEALSKNISRKGPRNCRSLGCAPTARRGRQNDKEESNASRKSSCSDAGGSKVTVPSGHETLGHETLATKPRSI